MSIVLLEDEAELREEVAAFLEKRSWRVIQAGSVAEFEPLMPQAKMAIIDVMLPDGSGFDVAERLRQQDAGCGIIMLTARDMTQDKLKGFYGGVDHYLVKPVKLLELAAVIDALNRRVARDWRLASKERKLIAPGGISLALSSLEIILCELLGRRAGQTVTRREIVEAFGYNWLDYDQRRLDTLVSRLRRRWRSVAGSEMPLKTEHREGYSFAASMTMA